MFAVTGDRWAAPDEGFGAAAALAPALAAPAFAGAFRDGVWVAFGTDVGGGTRAGSGGAGRAGGAGATSGDDERNAGALLAAPGEATRACAVASWAARSFLPGASPAQAPG